MVSEIDIGRLILDFLASETEAGEWQFVRIQKNDGS
jgi:hypothetical protein